MWESFLNELFQTTWIEVVAVITGLLSVWFSKKINILVYPVGIISVLLYVYIFYKNGLFANAIINFLYFVVSVYGWYHWKHPKNEEELPVTFLNKKHILILIGSFAFLLILLNIIKLDFNHILDYSTSFLGLCGMYLTARKKVENWICYLIADIVLIPLCIYNHLYFSSFQYLIFSIIAVLGLITWNKEAKKNV